MRIENDTDETIIIEPGESMDVKHTKRRVRAMSRFTIIKIEEVKRVFGRNDA